MAVDIRYTVNRGSITLKPKQPVIDWLNSVDALLDLKGGNVFDPLDEHGDMFLIPNDDLIESRQDAVAWVEKHWRDFFEFELGQWIIDDTLWPKKLSLKLSENGLISNIVLWSGMSGRDHCSMKTGWMIKYHAFI